jgi:hypothetical protein
MSEFEKQILETLSDLKIKRQEYKELSEEDGQVQDSPRKFNC